MKKNLLRILSLCALLVVAVCAKAQKVDRIIYYTDFTDWAASTAATSFNVTPKFSSPVSIAITDGVSVAPTTASTGTKGPVSFASGSTGSITTGTIANVSTVSITETVGKSSKNGVKVEAKGDGDADWVTLLEETVSNKQAKDVVVNRNNVQLRFSNVNSTKVLYLQNLTIRGEVDASLVPTISGMKANGVAVDIASAVEQEDLTMSLDVELSKSVAMISNYNPFTDITTSVGEVTSTTYEDAATSCKVTIVVSAGVPANNVTYIINVTQKPDYTVSYQSLQTGEILASVQVEKDKTLGSFPEVAVPAGQKLRGFYAQEIFITKEGQRFDSYYKITPDEVVTGDATYYVSINDIETANSSRNEYIFNDYINGSLNPHFYMEDHEGIEVTSGAPAFSSAAHGWLFPAGSQVTLQHSDGAQVAFYLCANNADDATISVGSETINAKATDNYSKAVKVSGTSTVVTFNANTYLHAIKVTNNIDARIKDENGYLQVAAGDGDALLAAIEQANNAGNVKIYLPNGTYDFGETVLTSITADNISIIGESMDGTIIRNEPESIKEGINLTATIHNKAANLYMQDLTLQNALDYYGSKSGAGRAVCLTDQGENTICKNVKMLSYQDTYYSHKASKYYWEDSEIHGTVDYICGDGDVVYNRVLFVNENRNASSTPNGETTTAAPYTSASCTWGYVMLDCTIDVKSKTFNLGRSWGGNSSLRYIRTTLNQPETLLSSRFTVGGMNVAAYAFYEYGTKNAAGNVICPASNVVTFTHASGNRSYETIIGAEGFTGTPATAEGYTIDAIFGDWHPDQIAAQAIPSTSDTEGVYLVNGSIVTELPTGTNMVRKANGRGGFGPETQIDITAVEMVEASEKAKAAEGAFVVDGKVVIVKNGKQFTAAGARIK